MKRFIPLLFLVGCSAPQDLITIHQMVNAKVKPEISDKDGPAEWFDWKGDCTQYAMQYACEAIRLGYEPKLMLTYVNEVFHAYAVVDGWVLDNRKSSLIREYPNDSWRGDLNGFVVAHCLETQSSLGQ